MSITIAKFSVDTAEDEPCKVCRLAAETLQVSRAPRAKLAHPLRRTAEMGKIVRQMRLEASMPPVRQNFDESEAREYAKVMLRPRVRTAPSAVYSRGGT